jgi:hypothetical protein
MYLHEMMCSYVAENDEKSNYLFKQWILMNPNKFL